MTAYRGAQMAIGGPESAFGTPATLDELVSYTGSPSVDWDAKDEASEVINPGALALVEGSYRAVESVSGSSEHEVKAKGKGRIYKAALGDGSSTLVSTGLYQQLFTLGLGPLFDALTLQFARPMWDATFDVHTYPGASVTSIEWKIDNAGVLTETIEWDARTMLTNVAQASLTRVASSRFTFAGWTFASGVLTKPTTTTLASCTVPLTGVKSFSIKVENDSVTDDYRANDAGLKSQPPVMLRKITGQIEADNTPSVAALRSTWKSNGTIPFTSTFTAGTDAFQFAAAAARITGAPTPNADGTQPTVTIPFEVLKLAAATDQGFWLVRRTSDAAL